MTIRFTHEGPPRWTLWLNALVAAIVLLGIVGVVMFVAKAASDDPPSALEIALFSIILFTFEVGAGFAQGWLSGRQSQNERYGMFVRSAVRRTFRLNDQLGRIRRYITDRREELREVGLEEVVGEVLSTVAMRTSDARRQTEDSIEDWKEFAPDEIERLLAKLQDAKSEREDQIDVLKNELSSLSSQVAVMSKTSPDWPAERARIERETRSLRRQLERLEGSSALEENLTARQLTRLGRYKEAEDLLSERIAREPTGHTFYIGRARNRYCQGNVTGALNDLDKASALRPTDPAISRLRKQMEQGTLVVNVALNDAYQLLSQGNSKLELGEPDEALVYYRRASGGLNPSTNALNRAMVALAKGDRGEFGNALRELEATATGPNSIVQSEILRLLELSSTSSMVDYEELDSMIAHSGFSLRRSPLRFLRSFLDRREGAEAMLEVFGYVEKSGQDI